MRFGTWYWYNTDFPLVFGSFGFGYCTCRGLSPMVGRRNRMGCWMKHARHAYSWRRPLCLAWVTSVARSNLAICAHFSRLEQMPPQLAPRQWGRGSLQQEGGSVHPASTSQASSLSLEIAEHSISQQFFPVCFCHGFPLSQPYLSVSQKCLGTFSTFLLSGTVLDFNYFPPFIYRDLGSEGRWKSVYLFWCRDKELLSLPHIAMKYLGWFKLICQQLWKKPIPLPEIIIVMITWELK